MRPRWVSLALLWGVAQLAASLPTPQGELQDGIPQEINPVKAKFRTIPDPDLPGYPDFSVLADEKLSSWDDETWTLTTDKYMPGMFQSRVGLANGYVGANVAVTGPFFERDFNQTNLNGNQPSEGWPLRNPRQTFSTISGFYDCQDSTPETNFEELRGRGCESVIAGIPHPLGLLLRAGDQVLGSDIDWNTISNFQQTMRFRDGIEEWKYTWSPQNTDVQFDVEYKAFMHRTRPNVAATEMYVTPRGGNFNASIIDLLDGRSAVRSSLVRKDMPSNTTSIYVANYPDGVPGTQAWIFSNTNVSNGYADESSRRRATDLEATSDMSISQEWDVELVDGETAVFHKYVGLASSDKFSDPESTAFYESARASEDGWDTIKLEHVQEWNRLMCDDCVTSLRDPITNHLTENYIIKHLQIAWITSHYYMLQNLLPENGNHLNDDSISVGGLVSDTYAGFKFWDAETWMFPALAATNPEMAKQILKYRVKLLPQARANTQEDYVRMRYRFDDESALFPWTSGRYGNATGTGPVIDYEYHLNADIALMAFHYLRITGDEKFFQEEIWPVVNGIGHAIATLLVKQEDRYWLKNMTDPDEYANHIDNGAYTLGAFSKVLGLIIEYQTETGRVINPTWVDMRDNVAIAKALSGITKQYQTMKNEITVKQADVSLLTFPLDLPDYNLDDSVRDLLYYSQHQTADGPAMTSAIAAIAENRVAASGCAAFTYNIQAIIPNLRAPWYQYSEQVDDDANANGGTDPAFPFLTGHGGGLQIPLYEYLGLGIARESLTIRPNLPEPWRSMKMPDFYYAGNKFRASINNTHTTITRLLSSDINGVVDLYPGKAMPLIVQTRSVDEHGNRIVKDIEMHISVGQTITVENDQYWRTLSTENNFLQCKTTTSNDVEGPSNYAGAATDGNPATHWQASTLAPTILIVDTSDAEPQPIKEVRIDWGVRAPESARVFLSNTTEINEDTKGFDIGPIKVTQPYLSDVIEIRQGYRTVHNVGEGVWSAKYAILEVTGCQGCEFQQSLLKNGTIVQSGATVAELELIDFDENSKERFEMVRGRRQLI